MIATPFRGLWHSRSLTSCLILLTFTIAASADPKPLSKEEQAKVDKAIEKGIAYLKREQTKEGNWPKMQAIWVEPSKRQFDDRHSAGQCLLPAYALLEAGVSANDPVIQNATDYIRPRIRNCQDTYDLALGVLFFDRLGNSKDKQLIQTLAH